VLGAWQLYQRRGWRIVGAEQPAVRRGPGSGVWGVHTAGCGSLQELTLDQTMDCRDCPEPSGRLRWRENRHLLYLIRFDVAAGQSYHKFGKGLPSRVREHVTPGGRVVHVVEASITAVHQA